jgi:hypothetical protein
MVLNALYRNGIDLTADFRHGSLITSAWDKRQLFLASIHGALDFPKVIVVDGLADVVVYRENGDRFERRLVVASVEYPAGNAAVE